MGSDAIEDATTSRSASSQSTQAPQKQGVSREARPKASALDIAARSVLESQMIGGTVASMVAQRALDHCWNGLFQHAALRVGPEASVALLEKLEAQIEKEPSDVLEAAPGPRARLYQRLRVLAEGVSTRAPFEETQLFHQGEGAYRKKLAELRRTLRRDLSADHRDVIELRFARLLRNEEVAHVLAIDAGEVDAIARGALALAQTVLGKRPASRDNTVEGALLEAFALDPSHARAPRRRRRAPLLAPGMVIGQRYEIEELLGAGAFANVYRARDREVTDHVVALKILRTPADDPSSMHSAMRELRLIASVFHPSVVQLKDHGWHQERLWFVMPLYRGETLATRLRRGPLSRSEAREVFEPLAEALATMHRAGVLHQDIKPDNVFLADLDPNESLESSASGPSRRILPVLLDLGVAAKDAESVLAGTPAYFAPEVAARFAGAADPAPVGPKADVFSLALTLHHALDPEPSDVAFGGSIDAFVAYRATHAPSPSKRGDLRSMRASFERWLHFSPDARPTAEELRRELAELTRPQEERSRRNALLRWAVPTALALSMVFGSVVYGLSREASQQRTEAQTARERAEQARQRAARASATLSEQQARRRELEATVARLEEEYQSSRMTREQLASRLAQAEAELAVLTERQTLQLVRTRQQENELRDLREQNERVAAEHASAIARREDLASRLDRVSRELDGERNQRERLEAQARDLGERLQGAISEAQVAQARLQALQAKRQVLLDVIDSSSSAPPIITATPDPRAAR
jgi:serine/threonine protein kinase